MRVSDLCNKRVRSEDGVVLGHVEEVHVEDSRITALTYGVRGLFRRLTSSRAGHRIGWDRVIRITDTEIVVRHVEQSKGHQPRPHLKARGTL
jgi:sporulation protein YlmC with PRC-barrel domain